MNKLNLLFLLTASTFFLGSCNLLKNNEDKGAAIARVNERVLYEAQIPVGITNGLSTEDSVRVIKSYVESWVKEQVLVGKAEQNISLDLANIEERIQSYRNSLLVFEYERALVQERLDTAISEDEIVNYYKSGKSNFALQEPAYRFYYFGIQDNHDTYKVTRALRGQDPVKMEELKAYGLGYGARIYFEDESWVTQSELIQATGIIFPESDLNSLNTLKVLKQDGLTHYLYILERKSDGEIAPISLVRDEIRAKVINDRKFKLISTMRNDLFNEALNKKDAEIYF